MVGEDEPRVTADESDILYVFRMKLAGGGRQPRAVYLNPEDAMSWMRLREMNEMISHPKADFDKDRATSFEFSVEINQLPVLKNDTKVFPVVP